MLAQLRDALTDGDVDGAVLEAETVTSIGSVTIDTLIEAASGDPDTQLLGYRALCDLLTTRLAEGADQVIGCLLIDGDPDPSAYASGLDGMTRADGSFTPVLPLSAEQAKSLVGASVKMSDIVDSATALIEIAASKTPLTKAIADTVLYEIDELIARHAAVEERS